MAEVSAEGKVRFELVAPERVLAREAVDMVVAPGAAGDFGVLPGHSLLMSLLRPGVIEIWQANQVERRIFVAGGFAEVNPESCIVLAEDAQDPAGAGGGRRPVRLDAAQHLHRADRGGRLVRRAVCGASGTGAAEHQRAPARGCVGVSRWRRARQGRPASR